MSRTILTPMLCFLLLAPACKEDHAGAPPSRLASFCKCKPGTERTRHYRLWIQEQPSGHSWLKTCRCEKPEGQQRLEGKETTAFSRAGRRVELRAHHLRQLNARGAPIRLRSVSHQLGAEKSVVEAQREGTQLRVWKQGQDYRLPWDPAAFEEASLVWFTRPREMEVGQEQTLRVFSLDQGQFSDWTVQVLERGPDGSSRILFLPGIAPGMRVWSKLDAQGWPTESRVQLGRMTMRTAEVEASKPKTPLSPPELSSLFHSETRGHITRPDQLRWARYRLRHLPEDVKPEQLQGPGQQIEDSGQRDAMDIKVSRLEQPKPEAPSQMPEAHYLEDSPLLGLKDPDIQKRAGTLSAEAPGHWDRALRIRNWVHAEIEPDMGMNYLPAPSALRKGRGDCSEKSLLLTALARASGIPARAVGGLVYANGAFNGHMWAEVWTASGWRPLDAAFGPAQVSAARIRLEEVDLRLRQANAISLSARVLAQGLVVEILETSEGGAKGATSSSPSSP